MAPKTIEQEILEIVNQIPAAVERALTEALVWRHPGHPSQKVHGHREGQAIENANRKVEELTHLANNPSGIVGKVELTPSQYSTRVGNNALSKMDRSVKEAIASTEVHRQIKNIQTRIKKFESANKEIPVLEKMIITGESKGKKIPKDQLKELSSMLKQRQKLVNDFLVEFQ